MSDAAQANIPKYKAGFGNGAQKKDFCKTTPLKIVPGYSAELSGALGLGTGSSKSSKK